jgi:RNA polymerase sigma factor (sigma-70 family)
VTDPPAPDQPARLRIVSGDSYADWDELYLDNVVRVYRLLYSKVGNRSDAEDLTTEVFMAALGPLRIDASKGEVRAYLAATARSALARYWRSRLGVEVTTIDAAALLDDAEQPPSSTAAAPRVAQILAGLPDRHRRVLELRFLEAQSIKEAAQQMGISVANVKVLQHRALRMAARAEQGLPS